MDFLSWYIISMAITGCFISIEYQRLKLHFSVKRYVSHGQRPGSILTFVSLYLVAFIPILNALTAFLIVLQLIYSLSQKKK
jgi:hypothetical protein